MQPLFRSLSLLALLASGCASDPAAPDGDTGGGGDDLGRSPTGGARDLGVPDLRMHAPSPDLAAPAVTTVFTIVLENHDYAEVVGSSHAPYINSLIGEYGLATNYMD